MIQRPKKQFRRKPSSRVFPWAVDMLAFIDTIVLSVDGRLKPSFEAELQHPVSRGIYTQDSLYSRAVSGRFWLSGNPVDIVYGKKKKFKNVPNLRVTMRSERIPVTAAQIRLLVGRLILESQIRVSSVEFTFDVSGVTITMVLLETTRIRLWIMRWNMFLERATQTGWKISGRS